MTKASSRSCPICGRPRSEEWRPFCSKRCADVDLGRWLTGGYAIPVVESEDDPDATEPPGPVPDHGD